MTPIHSPETVQQVTNISGLEPAVIAALITGGVAILVAIIGNLWSWYIARKTLADSQTFERERLDRLIASESKRHKADLAEKHTDRFFESRLQTATDMYRMLSMYGLHLPAIGTREDLSSFKPHELRARFSLLFPNLVTNHVAELASDADEILGIERQIELIDPEDKSALETLKRDHHLTVSAYRIDLDEFADAIREELSITPQEPPLPDIDSPKNP